MSICISSRHKATIASYGVMFLDTWMWSYAFEPEPQWFTSISLRWGTPMRCKDGQRNNSWFVAAPKDIKYIWDWRTGEYFLIQRKTKMGTEGFSIGKEVLILFPTGFGKSFIYHLTPQVVLSYYVLWFVDLIGWISLWSMVIDRWLILSPAKRFLTMPALFQAVTKDDFSDGSV